MRALLLAVLMVAPLAACSDGKEGTTISFNATDPDGNVTGGVDGKTGKVAIKAPGFSGSLTLPKLQLDASNVDFNGVHLYPGSTVSSMNIDASGKDGKVRIAFESPAALATVRDWFAEKLGKADFALKAEANSLVGTDDEKKPFRIDFSDAGPGKTKGLVLAGN